MHVTVATLAQRTLRAIFSNSFGSPVTATTAAVTDFENICTVLDT